MNSWYPSTANGSSMNSTGSMGGLGSSAGSIFGGILGNMVMPGVGGAAGSALGGYLGGKAF